MTAFPSHPDDSVSWSPGLSYYGGKLPVEENAMTKKQAPKSADARWLRRFEKGRIFIIDK
jgi:hypothetical protein